MKGKGKGRRSTPKSKPLTGLQVAANVFAGLDSRRVQPYGRTLNRGRRGGRGGRGGW